MKRETKIGKIETRPRCYYRESTDVYTLVIGRVDDVNADEDTRRHLISQAAFGYILVIEANEMCQMPQGIWRQRRQYFREVERPRKWFGHRRKFNNIPLTIQAKYMDYIHQDAAPASPNIEAIFYTGDGYAVAHSKFGAAWKCAWIALDGTVIATDTFRGKVEMFRMKTPEHGEKWGNRQYYPRIEWKRLPPNIQQSIMSI